MNLAVGIWGHGSFFDKIWVESECNMGMGMEIGGGLGILYAFFFFRFGLNGWITGGGVYR